MFADSVFVWQYFPVAFSFCCCLYSDVFFNQTNATVFVVSTVFFYFDVLISSLGNMNTTMVYDCQPLQKAELFQFE